MLRTFGPVADALGIELAKLPPFATRNLIRLGQAFQRKNKGLGASASLNPRLVRQVFDEAMWSDDEIVAEYLSGVLAASGAHLANDRGVVATAQIRRMSATQLRGHYIFYSELLRHAPEKMEIDFRWHVNRMRHCVRFDGLEFLSALGLTGLSHEQSRQVIEHVVLGLARDQLIDEDSWGYELEPDGAGRVLLASVSFHPSPLGAELFLWGCGSAVIDQSHFLDPALELVLLEDFPPLTSTDVRTTSHATSIELSDLDAALASPQGLPLDDLHARADKLRSTSPDQAPGYFYLAIWSAMSGRDDAESLMDAAASLATDEQRESGLLTLDRLRAVHPTLFNELMRLSLRLSMTHS